MAMFGRIKMQLQVSHGSKKYNISLELADDDKGDVLTVHHLMKAIADVSEIKPQNQKLIYKGRSLTEPSQSLVGLGVRDGAKLMLLGKKTVSHDTEEVKKLLSVEAMLEKHENKMADMMSELNGISKGFLSQDLIPQALSHLKKQVGNATEQLMKQFEILDALRFDEDNKQARVKRKNVADKLNVCLDKCK
ncbi:hypothetical protein LOTGIDRAFT_202646, partial [Lottia gigantea]